MLVEDEPLLASFMIEAICYMNYKVLGPFATLEEGLKHATNSAMDLAILDLNLRGGRSFPIAKILQSRNIPFLFTSGELYIDMKEFEDVTILPKPFSLDRMETIIKQTLHVS
jgi:DNA-binding response OmpR family regulator